MSSAFYLYRQVHNEHEKVDGEGQQPVAAPSGPILGDIPHPT